MHVSRIARFVVPLVLAILLTAPAVNAAITTSHLASDAQMLALIDLIAFEAEGRWGDRGGPGTFEVDIGPTTSAPASTAQYAWPNAVAVRFTLQYNPATDLVTFTVGSGAGAVVLTYTAPLTPTHTEIFVRARALAVKGVTTSGMLVDNLVLDGQSVGDISSAASGSGGLDILWISCDYGSLSDGFTLTGQATMTWSPDPTSSLQSNIAFQIKIVDPPVDKQPPAVGGTVISPTTGLLSILPWLIMALAFSLAAAYAMHKKYGSLSTLPAIR